MLISLLFKELPVLKNYWDLTRVNLKSFNVKRLDSSSNAKLLSQIRKQQENKKQPILVQTTLTQPIQSNLKSPTNIDDMIQSNMHDFVTSPRKGSPTKRTAEKSSDNVIEQEDDLDKKPAAVITASLPEEEKAVLDDTELNKSDNNIDNDGFEQPKNPVPFAAISRKYNQTFSSVQNDNTNLFAIMAEDDLNETGDDDDEHQNIETVKEDEDKNDKDDQEDSGISFESSSKGSNKIVQTNTSVKAETATYPTITITNEMYKNLMEIIGAGWNEQLSEELLTAWIENRIKTVADKSIIMPPEIMDKLATKMHRFIDKDFQKMKQSLKLCQTESEVNAMRTIRTQSMDLFQKNEDTKKELANFTNEIKDSFAKQMMIYKEQYKTVCEDFKTQCKEYMQDHVLRRREIFTNQKAQFDKDIREAKDSMDVYMRGMAAAKTSMEKDLYKLKAECDVYKSKLEDIRQQVKEDLQFQSTARTNVHTTSQHSQPNPLHSGYKHETPRVTNETGFATTNEEGMESNLPQNQQSTQSPMSNVNVTSPSVGIQQQQSPQQHNTFSATTPVRVKYQRFDKVQIDGNGLRIAEATVMGHVYINNGLFYDVEKGNLQFQVPADHVLDFQSTHNNPHHQSLPNQYQRDSTVMHRQQQSSVPPVYHEDASVTSSYSNENMPRRQGRYGRTQGALMANQFRVIGQKDVKTIQATQLLKHAPDWTTVHWRDATTDPKDFYENLKARVQHYGIYIKPYVKITREESICALERSKIENYDSAYEEMSVTLYALLDQFQEKWFDGNPRIDLILHYENKRDGFGFIKFFIKHKHPNLRDISKCETMDKPNIMDSETFFHYMKCYRQWVEFEETSPANRVYTDYEHVSNILRQLETIEVFQTITKTIEAEMAKVHQNLIVFPEEYKLHNIGITILEMLPEHAKTVLPHADAASTGQINRVNRSGLRTNEKQNDKSKTRNRANRLHS